MRINLEAANAKNTADEAQARLYNAQREEIETRQRERHAQEQHEERMRFLTAPGKGIRLVVREETTRKHSTQAFTAAILAKLLAASEIEEALMILANQGIARRTALPSHLVH